jgi:hypothetical protein
LFCIANPSKKTFKNITKQFPFYKLKPKYVKKTLIFFVTALSHKKLKIKRSNSDAIFFPFSIYDQKSSPFFL